MAGNRGDCICSLVVCPEYRFPLVDSDKRGSKRFSETQVLASRSGNISNKSWLILGSKRSSPWILKMSDKSGSKPDWKLISGSENRRLGVKKISWITPFGNLKTFARSNFSGGRFIIFDCSIGKTFLPTICRICLRNAIVTFPRQFFVHVLVPKQIQCGRMALKDRGYQISLPVLL